MIAFRQKYQQEAKEPHCPFKMQYLVKNRVGSEKFKGTCDHLNFKIYFSYF